MPIVSLSDWNQYLQERPEAHLLQLGAWGELKKEFGWHPVRFIHADGSGAQILFRRLPLGFTIAYLPKPVFSEDMAKVADSFWVEADAIARQNRAVFLKVEPDAWQEQFNRPSGLMFRESAHNIQPPRTVVIDIRGDENAILERMKQKCRYNIRLSQKKGVTVRAWDDVRAFHEMMLVTGGRDQFGVHSQAYYQRAYELFHPLGMCDLLVAEYEGEPLASLMVFANGGRAWYVYGASNDRERNRMPAYLLQWEAIRWARAHGCVEYDLWGVPDENEDKLEAEFESRHDGLWGVYRFKRGFGGEVRRAAQALDRVYHPLLYWAYLKFIGSRS